MSALPLPDATPSFVAPAGWQAIDFISDLHLAADTPRAFDAWAAHLRHTRADAVFILGDLFEAWVGDDVRAGSFEARCVTVLSDAARGKTIAFMPGNRDFLVGDRLLGASGVMRLADPTVLLAFSQRLLVSHGDALCLADASYQRYRRIVRRPGVQRAFAALPRFAREAVGRGLRARGGGAAVPSRGIIDLDAEATRGWMEATATPVFVHGHTHAPASHTVAPGRVRHVLTDWHLDGSGTARAEVLRWRAEGIERIAPEGGPSPQSAAP